jgi:urease accessory protein
MSDGPTARPSAEERAAPEGQLVESGSDADDGTARRADDRGVVLPPEFEAYADEHLDHVPAGAVGKDGVLEATFAPGEGGTRLLRDYSRVPYHHTGTLDHDPCEAMTTLCVQTPTGGVAQGDRHRLSVTARADARASVTGQGATKVHEMHSNFAHLGVELAAESGAYLEYVPDPTILNRGSRCVQTVDVDLAPSATVVYADIVVPGGLSDHEPFGFDRFHSRLSARSAGRRVLTDTVALAPDERDPDRPGLFGEYDVLGTLYVLSPENDAAALRNRIRDRIADGTPEPNAQDVLAGASTLADGAGVAVRALGHRATDVEATLGRAWDATRQSLLGVPAPDLRKY